MKKIWSKLLSVVLACCIALPLAACGGGGPTAGGGSNDGRLKISLSFNRGAVQSAWFYDVEKRFEDATKDKVYGDKTGIDLEWTETTVTKHENVLSSGTNIYMDEGDGDFAKNVSAGVYMDITDVATSTNPYDDKKIADKLSGSSRTYKVNDTYYALPWKEFFTGIGYNASIFEKYGLYFSDVELSAVPYSGNVGYGGGTYYFTGDNPQAGKSAGLDGVKGTYDDGLPTTLEELMALCHKIKDLGTNWFPFACCGGNHEDYTNYLTKALLIGLEGSERFANYNDCDGEMEIVTGYTGEKLWGLDGVYVPTTSIVEVKANDRSTWINISKSVARYYAVAFIKYITVNTMICGHIRSAANNITVQSGFIFSDTDYASGHHSAMIMEGSYWYTEAEHNGGFSTWDAYMFGDDRPEFGIMPYVAAVSGSETNKTPVLAYQNALSNVFINNNLTIDSEGNKHVINACKEFLYFFYSDNEIKNYIEATGQNRLKSNYDWQQLVYEKDENGNYKNGLNGTERVVKSDCKLPNYQITVLELERDAVLLSQEPNEINPSNIYKLGNTSALMRPDLGVYYSVFKGGAMTVKEAFEATFISGVE